MKFTAVTKCILLTASLLGLLSVTRLSLAEPAHSASCPIDIGHSHSGQSDQLASTANAGTAKLAETQCSSCHGADGMGVSENIPNLAGQEAQYLCGWLAGCREQGDKCEGHEDLAAKFTNQDIADFAEFYARLYSKKW